MQSLESSGSFSSLPQFSSDGRSLSLGDLSSDNDNKTLYHVKKNATN